MTTKAKDKGFQLGVWCKGMDHPLSALVNLAKENDLSISVMVEAGLLIVMENFSDVLLSRAKILAKQRVAGSNIAERTRKVWEENERLKAELAALKVSQNGQNRPLRAPEPMPASKERLF